MSMTRAALLLVGGLLAVSACSGSPGGPDPGASPTAPATSKTGAAVDWEDLTTGRPPQIPYLLGNRYVTPRGGQELPVGKRGVSGIVAISGGFLVSDALYFEGTNGLHLIKDGARVDTWPSARHCSSGQPVGSLDGGFVAWVTVRCPETLDRTIGAIHRSLVTGSDEVTQPVGSDLASVVGFLGKRVVYNLGFQAGAWITDFHHRPHRVSDVEAVRSVSPREGLLIGQRGGEAHLILDANGRLRWRYDRGNLVAFSPDETNVFATQTNHRIVVLNAQDGTVASTIDLARGAQVWSAVWETNQSLLILHRQDGRVAVVRLYMDGRVERATAPRRVHSGDGPNLLLPHP